jgi:hypothetical protein
VARRIGREHYDGFIMMISFIFTLEEESNGRFERNSGSESEETDDLNASIIATVIAIVSCT